MFSCLCARLEGYAMHEKENNHHELIRSCAQTVVVGQRIGRMKLLGTR